MRCPECGENMGAWDCGAPNYEPAWHCRHCDYTISDEEADELMRDIDALDDAEVEAV
ncbi:MAG: hypothetical protein J2P21_32215 [Chloracidobacterium sp.]|nr:hypothetical protein [Chloracidobacterium sp.]